MGRKRLTKECTHCNAHCERKQFSRSMWEKEEVEGILCERVCRQCHFEIKKSREQATLLLTASSSSSTTTTSNPVAKPNTETAKPLLAAVTAQPQPQYHAPMTQLELQHLGESLLATPMFPAQTSSSTSGAASASAAGRPRPAPLDLEDDEFDQELFDGVDLDTMFVGEGDEREKRSVRAKRRRAKMNALFSALAADVGLSVFADRARVLERTREVLRDLREMREVKKLRMENPSVPMATKPIVSIMDVVSEHLKTVQAEIVTHSHCA